MYNKYNDLSTEAVVLRQKVETLNKNSNKYKQIVKAVARTYQDFDFKYKVASEETWRLIREVQIQ